MDCNLNNNLKNCNCSFDCERKGKCCECLLYHRKNGQLPACYFPKDVEKTGDRSVSRFKNLA